MMSLRTFNRLPAILALVCLAAASGVVRLPAQSITPGAPPPVPRAVPVNPAAGLANNSASRPAAPNAPNAPNSPIAPGLPGSAAPSAVDPLYQVAPEDVVTVKVYQEDDLLTTARVSKEGTINFPLIGSISIAGRTPEDAARVIAAQLARDYLVNPQVTVTVTEYSLRHFTVLGEVQKPGDYTMPDRNSVTLLEAIGDAGGYTRIADPANIKVKRIEGDGKESVIKLNAKSMASERRTVSFQVKPGDIITVGQSFF